MLDKYKTLGIIVILIIAATLRFYNLLHDEPYFFNPDERNMASAITQFRLPENPSQIPLCISSQLLPLSLPKADQPLADTSDTTCSLNPHFFAYGQFPLYLSYFSGIVSNIVLSLFNHSPLSYNLQPTTYNLNFPQAIFWLRFYSAFASTITVLIVYLISKLLFAKQILRGSTPINDADQRRSLDQHNSALLSALLSALFCAFTPGLIQSAHFGTTESLLTFFFMVIVYLSLKLSNTSTSSKLQATTYTFFSITMGEALATKLSAGPFAIPFICVFIYSFFNRINSYKRVKNVLSSFLLYFSSGICITGILLVTYIILSPFNTLSFHDFYGTSNYEISVATGESQVFYTRQFINTTPIVFHMGKVFPFALGPLLFIFGTLGILFMFIKLCIKKQGSDTVPYAILLIAFFSYFLPNALLFAKWTRFMTPVFPLFSVFAVIAYSSINKWINLTVRKVGSGKWKVENDNEKSKMFYKSTLIFHFSFCILLLLPGAAFMSIYTHEDSRVTASRWIYKNIPSGSHVLSETANVIDIPLSLTQLTTHNSQPTTPYNLQPVSFDFYNLDVDPLIQEKLLDELVASDYIFIPSRRLFSNAMRNPKQFPHLTRYYQELFSGALGFTPMASISSFPALLPMNQKPQDPMSIVSNHTGFGTTLRAYEVFIQTGYLPDEVAEETWTVFDHPVIRIYKKTRPLSKMEYRDLLNIQTP